MSRSGDARLPFAGEDDAAAVAPVDPNGPLPLVRVAVERSLDTGQPAGTGRRAAGQAHDDTEGLTYLGAGFAVGARVEVPLGRGNAAAHGYVLAVGGRELLGSLDPARLKAVRRAAGPVVPPMLIELARWIARYYVTPLGMVLTAMVPGAAKARTGVRTERLLTRAGPAPADLALPPAVAAAWAAVAGLPGDVFPIEPHALAALARARNLGPINKLVKAGLLTTVERERIHARGDLFASSAAWADRRPPPPLTPAQASVVEAVWPAEGTSPAFGVHLLLGVTGSGKTEVYLRLIERCLAAGRNAIVLVPEIGLTPQTAGRFIGRFPEHKVVVLHSGLSASARHAAWDHALKGEARVVVGARSAVFAPLPDLGIIIVDEEHDNGYKQDSLPRYHGRDVAIKRAQLAGCPVLLGSATPSLESYANAIPPRPRYILHRMPDRVGGGVLPIVRVVDIAAERRAARDRGDHGLTDLVGPTLFAALRTTLDAGGQAVLLLNRRGYAGHLACSNDACGWVMTCHHCDVKLVLHRAGHREGQVAPGGFLRCHHCRAEQVRPSACPSCGKRAILLGSGTQRAEEQIEALLRDRLGLSEPDAVVRVDADAMASPIALHHALLRFTSGATRVLLGTQMIAKGMDVANVRLVGVLSADTALAIPDFRAAERTFQLVAQVAGRAGRGEFAGTVIVQTMDPAQPAIRFAAAHDYERFATGELRLRREAGFPPAVRMARVVCRNADRDRAEAAAAGIAADLRALGGDLSVNGPLPCPIARVADHFRIGVEVTAADPRTIQNALASLRHNGRLKSDIATAVDVDPVNLL